ncbi:hypothetical protein [Zavarzinella formosa]|uniref:hypothetical protein n=1 Tax=Zavarzinella formosa TaxID=360055 RepID=UPI000319B7CA|nr:hypothetical protein [Zavarzinella formosa]
MSSSSASPMVHLKRAFAWNLAKVLPSDAETADLNSAGITDPTVRRYAVWRRSLLLVALAPTTLSLILGIIDTIQTGFGEFTLLGKIFELAWVAALAGLALSCVIGIFSWKKPGRAAGVLAAGWLTAFLLPFISALLPAGALYHVQDISAAQAEKIGKSINATKPDKSKTPAKPKPAPDADADEEEDDKTAGHDPDVSPATLEKIQEIEEVVVEFALSGSAYLLLLPAVLSIIPGAVNGCLRIKSLLPASQLPGWFLVCAAPAFLLFWTVILVIANHAARSPFLVFGVLLWAGAPIWYSICGKVFISSQITENEAGQIGRIKLRVLVTTLIGLAFLLAFVMKTKVVGLNIVGFDKNAAVSTKLDDAFSADDEVNIEEVQMAVAESKSFIYAFDLSSWRFVVDFLAKLLVVTGVFADLILRATVSAWRNERTLRSKSESGTFDESMNAAQGMIGTS